MNIAQDKLEELLDIADEALQCPAIHNFGTDKFSSECPGISCRECWIEYLK